jgi:hypothetical protein
MAAAVVLLTFAGSASAKDWDKDHDHKCGDGFRDIHEDCDDGNRFDGDG